MRESEAGGRGGFLCGLDRDELECSNVREMANPHLPFPRARAYAGKRGVGKDKGSRLRWRKTGNARGAYVCTRCVCPGAVCHAHSCDLQLMKLGCSRVACQINMSPILRPTPSPPPPPLPASYSRPHQQTTYPLYPLPPQRPRSRFSPPFFVNLPHIPRPMPSASAHFNPFAYFLLTLAYRLARAPFRPQV